MEEAGFVGLLDREGVWNFRWHGFVFAAEPGRRFYHFLYIFDLIVN
jgi:hypothetical protein